MTRLRHEALLARTFFFRFFENDVLPAGIAQTRLVFSGLVVLTAPMYLLTFVFLLEYERVHAFRPDQLPLVMLEDQLVYVTVSMIGLGAVALVSWDGVFPDRRDARTFGVLPLPLRTMVIGKLAALGALALLFAIGPNLLTGVLYGTILWMYDGAADPVRSIAGHVVACSAAGVFVFFSVLAIQGTLLGLLGRRLAQRAALLFQTSFVALLMQTLLFLPYLRGLVGASFGPDRSADASWLPPAWFLGLYNAVGGIDRVVPLRFALFAIAASTLALSAAMLLVAVSYGRLTRQAIETLDVGSSRWHVVRGAGAAGAAAIAKNPVTRCIAVFTVRTLYRSRVHIVLLSTYAGFAAAVAASTLIPQLAARGIAATFASPGLSLLSIPLVFNFFLIVGARVLFGIPTDLKANWTFRFHLTDHHAQAVVAGTSRALLIGIALQIALVTFAADALLWGVRTAVIHAAFTLIAGWLLAEVLVIDFRSVPFTRIYAPGHWRLRGFWPLYLLVFSLYAYSLARLAQACLARPSLLAVPAAAVAIVVAAARVRSRRAFRASPGLTFLVEDVDPMFAGFGLSESIAADTQRTMFTPARSSTRRTTPDDP